jgi:hypothetical protein
MTGCASPLITHLVFCHCLEAEPGVSCSCLCLLCLGPGVEQVPNTYVWNKGINIGQSVEKNTLIPHTFTKRWVSVSFSSTDQISSSFYLLSVYTTEAIIHSGLQWHQKHSLPLEVSSSFSGTKYSHLLSILTSQASLQRILILGFTSMLLSCPGGFVTITRLDSQRHICWLCSSHFAKSLNREWPEKSVF